MVQERVGNVMQLPLRDTDVIFLSHASENVDVGSELCDAVQSDGTKVWSDQEQLRSTYFGTSRSVHKKARVVTRATTIVGACLIAGCASVTKLSPDVHVCTTFDTREVLFTYAPAVAREHTIEDLTKRINRYLSDQLTDDKVPISAAPCKPADAVLSIRLDTLEPVASGKAIMVLALAVVPHVKMKYLASFKSPTGEKLFEEDGEPERETLDDLADKVASSLDRLVRRHYRKR